MNLNDLFNEEKVRLDPACWHNKKIGNPKTKMKGGTRVNNCVPKESVEEQSNAPSTANGVNTSGVKDFTKKALGKVGRNVMPALGFTDAAERLSNKDYTGAGISAAAGAVGLVPAWPAQVASGGLELVNMARDEANELGGYDKLAAKISKNFTPASDPSYLPENPTQSEGVVSGAKAAYNRGKDFVKYLRRDAPLPDAPNPNLARDIATGRNVGGKAIPSLGEPGKVVTSPTMDKVLTKMGGDTTSTTRGPTVKSGSSNDLPIDPFADTPTYIRRGLPDPVTVPKPGTKPKITVRPGETPAQAIERTRAEQEFGNFLKGQGGQKFGPPPAAQATSGPGQVPTITLPGGQTVPDPYRLSPSGQYSTQSKSNSEMDKIMQKWDKEQQSAPSSSSSPSKSKTSPSKFLQLFGPDKMDEASRKKREQPEAKYDDEYDAMVARVKKLAGLGPMKTVYDPTKRQYRNMPTAVQPKK